MTSSHATPTVLNADQEHAGVRTLVLVGLVAAAWLSFQLLRVLMNWLLPGDNAGVVISCVGTLPLTIGAIWVIEAALKRLWPSGNSVTLDPEGITVRKGREQLGQFSWTRLDDNLYWYFQLSGYKRGGQERRLPKNWLCLACELQNGDDQAIVYSYMPSKRAADWLHSGNDGRTFRELNPADVYDTSFKSRFVPPSRPAIPVEVIAGKDGRYWLAERRRWQDSLQLEPADFAAFMGAIQAHTEETA